VKEGEDCGSDLALLEEVDREIDQSLERLNNSLRIHYNLDFDKLSIPKALLILHEKLSV
jgi:hypothetical protein